MPALILHVLHSGFVDRINVLDWPADLSPIENVWLIMKRRMRQRRSQTAELLKSCIKRDWTNLTCRTLTISILNSQTIKRKVYVTQC